MDKKLQITQQPKSKLQESGELRCEERHGIQKGGNQRTNVFIPIGSCSVSFGYRGQWRDAAQHCATGLWRLWDRRTGRLIALQ